MMSKRRHRHVSIGHNVAIGENCHFGAHVSLQSDTRVSNVTMGDYSYLGGGSSVQHATIGKFCSIGPGVRLGLGLHPIDHVSTYPGFFSADASGSVPFLKDTIIDEHVPIRIGNDVWIGAGAFIMDGVHIGHGAVIGAAAMVTRDVEPYSVVGGVPARELRKRFSEDMVAFLLDLRWWDKDKAFLQAHAESFRSPETFRDRVQS